MPAEPDAQPLLVVSLLALPVLAEIERSTSATVALPVCSSCWRPITCTGLEASVSVRLMLEPVTRTAARVLASPLASAEVSAAADKGAARATARAATSRVCLGMTMWGGGKGDVVPQ